jgi:hypothetical protein
MATRKKAAHKPRKKAHHKTPARSKRTGRFLKA